MGAPFTWQSTAFQGRNLRISGKCVGGATVILDIPRTGDAVPQGPDATAIALRTGAVCLTFPD